MQIEDIGQGHFGIAKKMIYRPTGEQVAVKFIERGEQVCVASRIVAVHGDNAMCPCLSTANVVQTR